MKTFEQWFESFNVNGVLKNYAHDLFVATKSWNACAAEYEQRLRESEEVIAFYAEIIGNDKCKAYKYLAENNLLHTLTTGAK